MESIHKNLFDLAQMGGIPVLMKSVVLLGKLMESAAQKFLISANDIAVDKNLSIIDDSVLSEVVSKIFEKSEGLAQIKSQGESDVAVIKKLFSGTDKEIEEQYKSINNKPGAFNPIFVREHIPLPPNSLPLSFTGCAYLGFLIALAEDIIQVAGERPEVKYIFEEDIFIALRSDPVYKVLFAEEVKANPPKGTVSSLKDITARAVKKAKIEISDNDKNNNNNENSNNNNIIAVPTDIKDYVDNLADNINLDSFFTSTLEKIKSLMDVEEKVGATDDQIKEIETMLNTSFTDEVRLLWKYFDNFENVLQFLKFSNLQWLEECYESVTSCCKSMLWIPINDIDYDFCFNALDVDTGYIIQIDRECQSQHVLGPGIVPMLKKFVEELEKAYDANGKKKLDKKWNPEFKYNLGSLREVFPIMYDIYRDLEPENDD